MTPAPGGFDPLADGYDEVAMSAVGRHYRDRVHHLIDRHLPVEARVLDVGCGTGIDTARLAGAGHHVTAIDASAEMVARTVERLQSTSNGDGLAKKVDTRHQDMDTLDETDITGPFDLVLANFGVVNCCRDLSRFGLWLHSALGQSGVAVLATMAPICPPELLQGLLGRNRSLLTRRRSNRETTYADIPVRYLSANGLVKALNPGPADSTRPDPGLVLDDARSLGVVLPTFEQRRLVENRPRLLRSLVLLDRMFGSPAVGLATGDHHVAVVRRGSDQ